MSKALTANELRGLSREQLNAKVVELKEELFGLRFAAARGSWSRTGGFARSARTSPAFTPCCRNATSASSMSPRSRRSEHV